MNYIKRDKGFTLIEVLVVIIIIAGLAAVAIPRLAASTVNARQKADIATAHQVKAALDRYQIENGAYPIIDTGLTVVDGTVTCDKLIPQYISKLDKTTTQQVVDEGKMGFGVEELDDDNIIPDAGTVSNLIMIYLSGDGSAAEVRAYDEGLNSEGVLWTSAN